MDRHLPFLRDPDADVGACSHPYVAHLVWAAREYRAALEQIVVAEIAGTPLPRSVQSRALQAEQALQQTFPGVRVWPLLTGVTRRP